MPQFRFPIAIAYYCNKGGFHHAVEMAKRFALNARKMSADEFNTAAREFVNQSMKLRLAQFEEAKQDRI